jgi:hypothetical protein
VTIPDMEVETQEWGFLALILPHYIINYYIIILIASVNKKLQDRVSSLQKATISLSLSK